MRRVLVIIALLHAAPLSAQITGTGGIGYGGNPPALCAKGDVFSSVTLGLIYECSALNTWTAPSTFDGAYSSLTGKPTLFDGVYSSLSGKPTLGTAAATAITDYATSAQGTKADSALQPAGNGSALTGLTKSQVGLANVDNTSDATKAVLSATKLTTPRTINGVSFDGSANITVAAAGSTLTDNVPFARGGIGACAATSATTGTMTVNMTAPCVTITPTGAATFNASGGVAGQILVFSITTSGTSSFTLTWGTNFRKTGTLATGTTSARFFTVSFICLDGTTWTEIARTAVQS